MEHGNGKEKWMKSRHHCPNGRKTLSRIVTDMTHASDRLFLKVVLSAALGPKMAANFAKGRVGDVRIRPLFAWYDFWIGVFWDCQKRRLYVLPMPCLGIVFDFGRKP
jgi:hypothetical protein